MKMHHAVAVPIVALALSTACTKGSFQGKLVDGLTGQPVAAERVLLKAETTDFTCQVFETTTDDQGNFTVGDLCANMEYVLSPGNEMLFLGDAPAIDGSAQAAGAVEIKAWMAPAGSGVYILDGGELKPQRTYADLKTARILGSEQDVRYPNTQPKDDASWAEVPAGGHLVVVGKPTIDRLQVLPFIESPEVKFEPDREDIKHFSLGQAWHYIGIAIQSETEFELKTVELDMSKVVEAASGERAARYIQADALPNGKYALVGEKDRRTYMFRVGPAAAAPPAE